MKWIGQHVYDYVANFRNTVIIDSVSISAVQTSAESFVDNDTSIMTSAAIDDRINTAVTAEDLDLTTDSGTIAIDLDSETLTIAGGEGIDTSATSNTVTITGEEASTSNKGVASFASANFAVSSGAVSIKSGGVDLTDEVTGTLPVGNGGTGATSLTDNSILTGTGSSAIVAEANLTYDGNDLTATSSTSGKPIITIKNTTNDAAGSFLKFVKDKGGVGADGDDIGNIEFISDNTEQQQTSFAKILAEVSESLDTDEAGKLTLFVAASDGDASTLHPGLILEGEHNSEEVDVTLGTGASSTTTIAGTLTMGSTDAMSNAGLLSVANQSGITGLGTITSGVWQGTAIASAYLDSDTAHLSGTQTFTGAKTFSATTTDFASATSERPLVTIKNTNSDTNASTLQFIKDKGAAGADGDHVGTIDFIGDDAAQTQTTFARIRAKVSEADDTDEAGQLILSVAESDGTTTALSPGLILEGEHATDREVDVTIANGSASLTTISGTLTMGSTATLNNTGILQTAAQTNITSLGTLTALNVDDINLNGKVLTVTGDTDDTFTITTGAAGATTLATTDAAGADGHFEVAADGDITLDAAGKIYNESDEVYFTSPNSADPLIIIKNTTDDANGGRLRFLNSRGADGQDGDAAGWIQFYSYDDGTPSGEEYAGIKATIHDATSGQESGKLQLQVASHDGGSEDGLVLTGGSVDTEVDVTVGKGSASVTTIAGNLTVTSGLTMGAVGRRACFPFRGYGTSDGTNYEAPEILSDQNSPFEHDTSYGSDGLTAQEPRQFLKSGAIVMPYAGRLILWKGWAASAGSGTIDMSLFKATLTRNSTTSVTPVLIINTQFTALGNTKLEDFAEEETEVTWSAGDVIYTAVKGSTNNKLWYLDSTLEVEWTE